MADANLFPTRVDLIRYLADPSGIDRVAAPGADIGLGKPSLATSATAGFPHLATTAGTPTGVPTQLTAGFAPVTPDGTNLKLWLYLSGAWRPLYLPQVVVLTYTAAISLDPTLGPAFKVTTIASTAATINAASAGVAGQTYSLIVVGDATGGDVITFGTNFKTTGTLTVAASKDYVLRFISDGTTLREAGRTAAL
jgi:hypothetical protein